MQAIQSLSTRELLDEKRALEAMIARMEVAMTKAANYLISQFAPNGPIMREKDVSYCHKVTWGLFEDARLDAVNRLLDWLDANAKQGVGRYYFPEEPPFNKEMQLLYRFLTFGKIAEAMRHPAFCRDEIRAEILTYQHSSGGAFGNKDLPEYMQALNPLFTSFLGQWALAAHASGVKGMLEPAEKAGDFLVRMNDLNAKAMNDEPGRYYFSFDPQTEKLITKAAPGENINCFVDTVGAKQHFYFIGTSMALLADLYAVTGKERYLTAAEELARFEQRLKPEALKWPSYCKVGWGAAELYGVTGKLEHRVMAANVSDITFMAAQTKAGGWEDMFYPLRDDGAWTQVAYDGKGQVPQSIENDGSWAKLAGQEITGEFMGEMGHTLKVFKAALGEVERKLACG